MSKIISLIFTILSCSSSAVHQTNPTTLTSEADSLTVPISKDFEFGYELSTPKETFSLSKDLYEISGLGINKSETNLYAVQDEKGVIFKLSIEDGSVLEKIKFHKDGDYEGIELVGEDIYVVKSTGTVYEVTQAGTEKQQMKKFNYFLSGENDVEGLAYDKKNNRLLIACKGIPATGESFEAIRYKKVIYAFDLATKTISTDPVYTIQLKNICDYLSSNTSLKKHKKLVKFFSTEKENLTFNPSAIAVHPITGNIYVTSSSGKVLIVMDEAGKVVYIEKLDKAVHSQPEGMTFGEDGTLFISNEGKDGKTPKIYEFKYQG